jgi:hypothetical protein
MFETNNPSTGGCGFGDAQPNDTAAKALTGGAKKRGSDVREYMA